MTSADGRRQLLLELLQAGLERVEGRRCVREALLAGPSTPPDEPVWAAAVGKAACSMALGAVDALGCSLTRVLVVTKSGHLAPELLSLPGVEAYESAHPLPDERSLAAGRRLLDWVDALPAGVSPLFLVSGGASSLVEVLEPDVSLAQLEQLSARGLAEGVPIGELNARRARLSRIKGGRLAAHLGGRAARALFISDVPEDDPAVIGSGLLGPAADGVDRIERRIVASLDRAMEGVVMAALQRGLSVEREPQRFEGEAMRLAARFTHELLVGNAQVRVWGGESTVHLPAHPGRGGRNQHLALAAARYLPEYPELMLLVAGTDGTDGPTEAAGGLVDAETCARLALAGLEAEECLRRADSGTALAAAEALVRTGPTGTNVADLAIGLKLPRADVI
ncbi:MAG: glycerate kinase type-2 family protein [Steroidobacteraceae bacterium]